MKFEHRALKIIVGIGISAFFLYLTLRKTEWDQIVGILGSVQIGVMVLSVLPKLLGILSSSIRTQALLFFEKKASFLLAVRSNFIAFAGNNLLPLRLGSALRIIFLKKTSGLSIVETTVRVSFEHWLDIVMLLFFIGICTTVGLETIEMTSVRTGIYLVVAVIAGGIVILANLERFKKAIRFLPKFAQKIAIEVLQNAQDLLALLKDKRKFLGVAGGTLLFWFCSYLTVKCWLWAFGMELPWHAPIFIITFITLAALLPSSPAFIGVYHFGVTLALSYYQIDKERAVAFALLTHAFSLLPLTAILTPLFVKEWIGFSELKTEQPAE